MHKSVTLKLQFTPKMCLKGPLPEVNTIYYEYLEMIGGDGIN